MTIALYPQFPLMARVVSSGRSLKVHLFKPFILQVGTRSLVVTGNTEAVGNGVQMRNQVQHGFAVPWISQALMDELSSGSRKRKRALLGPRWDLVWALLPTF